MRRTSHWQVPILLAAASAAAAAAGDAGRTALRFEREAIAGGEAWRLVTGHLVHLNVQHLALNLAGLALVWLLVGDRCPPLRWWLVIGFSLAVIDAGFWFLDPALSWYVGLSGLLHAVLVAGAVAGLRGAPVESSVLAGLVIAKVAIEQLSGPLPGSEAASGGPVVVNAHLYGTLAGLLAGVARLARAKTTGPPI